MATKPIKNTVTMHLTSLRQRNLDSAKTRSCLSISVNIPKSNNPQINDPAIQEAIRKFKKKPLTPVSSRNCLMFGKFGEQQF